MNALLENDTLGFLDSLTPEAVLEWAWRTYRERAAILTSLQNTGCVMIDMAHRVAPGLRVITVDTLRLPQETYDLIAAIEQRYGVNIERFQPDPERLARMTREHGEYLFFDSRGQQQLCCQVRKVEPNERAIETIDVWITGLRRDQSKSRRAVPKASLVDKKGRRLIKVCPLIDWTEERVWDYIRACHVPYNPLYDTGYSSLGCVICSTPTRPGEDKRAGRWRWQNPLADEHAKECGIHVQGSGI